jgi:putative hydrolase of the HAD superfamily
MPATPFKALFFDAVGTLFAVRGSIGKIYSEVAQRYGANAAPSTLDNGFKMAFGEMERLAYESYPREEWDRVEKEWWFRLVRRVFQKQGRLPDPYDAYFEEVYRTFEDWRCWEVYPDVPESLRRWKKEGYIIGIISNFDRRIYPIAEGLGVSGLVDSIHLPRDAGAAKPDRRIFEAALSRHRILPEEAMHVGDHPLEDVEGARGAGLTPVLIERTGGRKEAGSIRTLSELAL